MSKLDYQAIFNLKPEEYWLDILICAATVPTKDQDSIDWSRTELLIAPLVAPLPFRDQNFDLVLVDQIFFQANDSQSAAWDKKLLIELLRVGTEIRIFPVVDAKGNPASYLASVLKSLQEKSLGIELCEVHLPDNKVAAMLRVWNVVCELTPSP